MKVISCWIRGAVRRPAREHPEDVAKYGTECVLYQVLQCTDSVADKRDTATTALFHLRLLITKLQHANHTFHQIF